MASDLGLLGLSWGDCQDGALPESALEELIGKACEFDMEQQAPPGRSPDRSAGRRGAGPLQRHVRFTPFPVHKRR